MDLTVSPLTAGRWPALEDLFGPAGASNGCWCMYWRLGPRYRDRPREDNKDDLRRLAASGQPPGLLAFDGGIAVGWCELAPGPTWGGWRTAATCSPWMTCPARRFPARPPVPGTGPRGQAQPRAVRGQGNLTPQ
jgi:hypothetical protein